MMFCVTCNIVHEHALPENRRSGGCMCTYLGHEVREATEAESKGFTYEQRLASNVIKAINEHA